MLPKEWNILCLKDVSQKIQDGNYGADYPKSEELIASGIPFLTSKVIGGCGTVNQDKFDYISEEKHQRLKKAQIKSGDILFTNRGANVGTIAMTPDFVKTGNIGPQLTLIRCSEKIEKDYLFHFLRGPFFQKQVHQQDSGSAMNFFGIRDTERFKVLVPPLLEQKNIAQLLSTWDKAITTTELLLANSRQHKKALTQQLLTGTKRLLDKHGVRFSGKRESHPLKKLLQLSKGDQLNKDTLSKSGEFRVINGGIEPSGYTSEYNTEANTITISEGGNSCGFVGFQSSRFWCGGHCYAIKNLKIDLNFAYQLLKFNQPKIMRLRVGSGLPNIQKKDVEALSVSYPVSEEEQQKIASVLSIADQEITALQKMLDALKQEKKALMQQLLTGKLRVKPN